MKTKQYAGGPKSEAGKKRSSRNSLKHGIFSAVLVPTDGEKADFELLQKELLLNHRPTTAMQRIAFDRIICAIYRLRRVTAREMRRLDSDPAVPEVEQSGVDLDSKTMPPSWYGSDPGGLLFAERLLTNLLASVVKEGANHLADFKEDLNRVFGSTEFYNLLESWNPGSIDSILMAEQWTNHAELFKSPRPEESLEVVKATKKSGVSVVDRRSRWSMMAKLVEQRRQHVRNVRALLHARASDVSQSAAANEDGRYHASASRELERAVAWYQYVKENEL